MAKLSEEEVIRALEEPDSEQDFSDSEDDPDYIVETGDSDSSSDLVVRQNHNLLNNSGNVRSTTVVPRRLASCAL
jgi:hypothetical protein